MTAGRPMVDPQVQPVAWNQDSSAEATGRVPQLMNNPDPLLPVSPALMAARQQMIQQQMQMRAAQQGGAGAAPGADALRPPPRDTAGGRSGDQPLRQDSATPPAAAQAAASGNVVIPPSAVPAPPMPQPQMGEQSARAIGVSTGLETAAPEVSVAPGVRQASGFYVTQDTGLIASGSVPVAQTALRTDATGIPAGNSETPSISLAIPSLEIQAFGPGTVGIHKPVQYRIIARNRDSIPAQRISVALNLPPWVQIQNVNTTGGRRERADDPAGNRVNWMIDQIPPGQAQSLIVDLVATRAETFDLGIDWAMQPINSASRVGVTEPRLEMNIAGPNEVQYGETALYNVSVRNPGTGTAENVTVMLPEALGGERATIGDIAPGQERTFQVELLARAAGQLDLTTTAAATGNLQASSTRNIMVRRPQLQTSIAGPPIKYAGTTGQFEVTITNNGDAVARDVVAAIALPAGVSYVSGIDGAETTDGGLRWAIGTLAVGDVRRYQVQCLLNVEGQVGLEVAARGSGEIAGVARCTTLVETVADLILTVDDPKGPLPLNQKVDYTIRIRNRGTRSAENLDLTFMFSEGIEPTSASGLGNSLEPGKVVFAPIRNIDPGQEIVVTVTAQASQAGIHRFRAQLTGSHGEAHEVREGTTRFYGDELSRTATMPSGDGTFNR